MSVVRIDAIFGCDGCGCEFGVEIDTASRRPVKWSLFDIAEDALRGGSGWVTAGPQMKELGAVSLQNGKHLCPACTAAEDAKHTNECEDAICDGACVRRKEAAERQATGGCWVRPEVAAKLGLRQPGESAKAYAMRKGIR